MGYHSNSAIILGLGKWTETCDCPDSFNTAFIESVSEYFYEHDRISSGQRNALDNIVDKFDIDLDKYI